MGSAQSAHAVKLPERDIVGKKPLMDRFQVAMDAGTMMSDSVSIAAPRTEGSGRRHGGSWREVGACATFHQS